jgi:transposase-like protein
MAGRNTVMYSEPFKLQVVVEIESGKLGGPAAACRRYGIASGSTVRRWLREYGKASLVGKVVRVQTTTERDAVKRLETEIRELKDALAKATVDKYVAEGYFHVLCERMGVEDVEGVKKKIAETRPGGLSNSGKAKRP